MKDLELINNDKAEFFYDIAAGIMAVIAVIIVILEFSNIFNKKILNFIQIADNIVYIIFAGDYILRLLCSKDKKTFFKNNIIDIFAILPYQFIPTIRYGSVFKLIRVGTYILRLFGNVTEILFTNGLIYVITLVLVINILGSIGIYLFESKINDGIKSYGDAVWICIVTVTGVGYGDIVFSTLGGRVIASILMFTGVIFLGIVTSTMSTFYLGRSEKKILKENLKYDKEDEKKKYLDISDLSKDKKEALINYYEYLKKQ